MCCFEAFDDNCNRVFVWWLSWIFLCGVLACCIAGFVTANRFGFSLYGAQCAYERIYDDIMYGQLKTTYPKWEGRKIIEEKYEKLEIINGKINKSSFPELSSNFITYSNLINTSITYIENITKFFIFPFPKKIFDVFNKSTSLEEEKRIDSLKKINKYIKYK